MPENAESNLEQFSREFYKKTHQDAAPNLATLGPRLAEENNLDFVDKGHACVVVKEKGQDKHVVAFTTEDVSPEKAKEIFHTQRILATLFPYNFPRFRASAHSDETEGRPASTVREYIKSDWDMRYGFSKAQDGLSELGIKVWLDQSPGNFVTGENGGQYYVDVPSIRPEDRDWDKQKILRHMRFKKRQDGKYYSEADRRSVASSLEKLTEIGVIK
jgi:hypothetical protein